MKLWILTVREELVVLGQQIKTSTKLSENSLYDKPTTNTSSIVETSIDYVYTSHAHIGQFCRLCGESFDIESYNDTRMYCPNCEKALNEIVKWWGETTWLRQLAENKEQIEKDITESISITATNPAIKIKK